MDMETWFETVFHPWAARQGVHLSREKVHTLAARLNHLMQGGQKFLAKEFIGEWLRCKADAPREDERSMYAEKKAWEWLSTVLK